MKNKTAMKERFFSIELNSKINLKNVNLTNGNVLVEGTIGKLLHARFVEGVILEIVGNQGILRIDLAENEFDKPTLSEATAHEQ